VLTTGNNLTPGALAGELINPDIDQSLQFYIVSNDANSLTVWGDASAIAEAGDAFQVFDYHLQPGSPCVDAGTDAGVYDDLDGQVRPQGNGFDMGAYELPEPATLSLLALGALAMMRRRKTT